MKHNQLFSLGACMSCTSRYKQGDLTAPSEREFRLAVLFQIMFYSILVVGLHKQGTCLEEFKIIKIEKAWEIQTLDSEGFRFWLVVQPISNVSFPSKNHSKITPALRTLFAVFPFSRGAFD